LCPSMPRKDTKRAYAVNANMDFNYICGLLPNEIQQKVVPPEILRHHSEGLKDAIQQWIASFPAPNAGYPFDPDNKYQDGIKKCQDHLLFMDLENHLPEMGYKVWRDWGKYKEDLLKLQMMKEDLLVIIKNDISKCFKGIKLIFISTDEGMGPYQCYMVQKILYNLVLDLSGRISGEEANDNYIDAIWGFKDHSEIIEKDMIMWKIVDTFIIVPKEKRDLLIAGVENFKILVEDTIEKPYVKKEGKEIMRKIKDMERNRSELIGELQDALQYYTFPGECKYLAGY
jgi:hypothetical protein